MKMQAICYHSLQGEDEKETKTTTTTTTTKKRGKEITPTQKLGFGGGEEWQRWKAMRPSRGFQLPLD